MRSSWAPSPARVALHPTRSPAASFDFLEEEGCAGLPARWASCLEAPRHRVSHGSPALFVLEQDRDGAIRVSGEECVESIDQEIHPGQYPGLGAEHLETVQDFRDHGRRRRLRLATEHLAQLWGRGGEGVDGIQAYPWVFA